MKKRWLKSVIENSKAQEPVLPFHRSVRLARRQAPEITLVKKLKTA